MSTTDRFIGALSWIEVSKVRKIENCPLCRKRFAKSGKGPEAAVKAAKLAIWALETLHAGRPLPGFQTEVPCHHKGNQE